MIQKLCSSAVLLLSLVGAAALWAQTLPPGVTAGPSAQGINEYRLANGLVVLLFPESSKPTVTVNVTYLVGARHGNYGETGMAHLLEHMVFKGTPQHPDIPAEMRAHGAQNNASTGIDYTNYFQHFAADAEGISGATSILGQGPSGRLHKALVETGKTVSAGAFSMSGEDAGAAIFYAILKPDASLESARDELIAQVESFARSAPSRDEVGRFQLEVANRAARLLADAASLGIALSTPIAAGDWRLLFLRNERLQQLNAETIQNIAGAYFRRDARNVGMFIPDTEPQRATIPAAPSAAELLADFKDRAVVAGGEAFDATPANIDLRTRRMTIGTLQVALLSKKTRGAQVQGQ